MKLTEQYDVVVAGGGLAGFCAAVSAARLGARTCLVQDRPVLGGNSSSEVRVQTRGASIYHAYAREGGIMQEIWVKERHDNHKDIFENGWANSVWDMTLYDIAQRTDNLTLRLNTSVQAVSVVDGSIESITGIVANAETEITFEAGLFIDCTGDGVVAHLAGCEYRVGEESRDEFDEPHAPEVASEDPMGSSLHFEVVDTGREVSYDLPEWAVSYDDDDFFYKGGRVPFDLRGGYWWIELGKPWHTIYENEKLRHELTRHTLGIWDWLKNKNPRSKDELRNHALEWIGQVPGKRESRRIMGLHLLKETELYPDEPFDDEVAYGGWNIDLHTVGGLLASTSEPTAAEGYVQTGKRSSAAHVAPYGIPLRSLIARDVDNLMLAGRDVSATHVALGSIRVQATCALMGQGVGTAAALAVHRGIPVHSLPEYASTIQQRLLRDGCFLPNHANTDAHDLARNASVVASSEMQFSGTPEDRWRDVGFRQPEGHGVIEPLAQRRGQWLPYGPQDPPVERIELLLENTTESDVEVPIALQLVEHIWDYEVDADRRLVEDSLVVPPGRHWVVWEPGADAPPGSAHGGYLRVDVGPSDDVGWVPASGLTPGAVSAFEMRPGHMRRFRDGSTMSLRVSPARSPWGAHQVISGECRPHATSGQWRSDEAESLPQWVQLSWPEAQRMASVTLMFPGHLLCEADRYPSLYRDPQTAKHYRVELLHDGRWTTVAEETDNYMPHRVHHFEPQQAEALRVTVFATNGDPSASIYEVRCYADDEVWSDEYAG